MVLPPPSSGIAHLARGVIDQANRAKAQLTKVAEEKIIPSIQHRTQMYTYVTVPDGRTKLLYSSEQWSRVRLILENTGPVDVGTSQDLGAILSGVGITLETDTEIEFDLPRGDRLYIASATVNRVKFIVQPIPWLEQITRALTAVAQRVR